MTFRLSIPEPSPSIPPAPPRPGIGGSPLADEGDEAAEGPYVGPRVIAVVAVTHLSSVSQLVIQPYIAGG